MNGIKIKEGVAILIPVFDIHYDPKTWKDPETFDPERYKFTCVLWSLYCNVTSQPLLSHQIVYIVQFNLHIQTTSR